MPVCSSGTSGQKPGAAQTVILTSAVLASILPASAAWLEPFIGAIAGIITLDLPTFCAVDPPADPGLTAADIIALITLGPGPLTADSTTRFNQLMERYAWYVFCQCNAVVTPAAPTFPTAPTGLPAYNPPGATTVAAAPCASEASSVTLLSTDTNRDFHTNTLCDQTGHPTCVSLARPIPSGATEFQIYGSAYGPILDSNAAHTWTDFVRFYNASNVFVSQLAAVSHFDQGPPTGALINYAAHSDVTAIPAGATQYTILCGSNTGTADTSMYALVNWFCSTAGANFGQTCCTASDPITTGTLSQILQLVTLIQRYVAPFAFVPGASHTGLSGNGTLTIPSCIGIQITLTTIPTSIGQESGSPNEFFQAGWFSWGNSTAFTERVWVHKSPQLSFPAGSAQYTRIGYSLSPGVVATIQELYAET